MLTLAARNPELVVPVLDDCSAATVTLKEPEAVGLRGGCSHGAQKLPQVFLRLPDGRQLA